MRKKVNLFKRSSFVAVFILFSIYGQWNFNDIRRTIYEGRHTKDDIRTAMDERLWSIDLGLLYAADKTWLGSGDGSTWADEENWSPAGIPSLYDDVTIDIKDASAAVDRTFEAKSLTVGGASASTFTSNDFIYGMISPSSTSDEALYIRKDGAVTLKGEGTITLKGKFKNTQEALVGEESFMFTLE